MHLACVRTLTVVVMSIGLVVGCGGEPPPGPDVVGYSLPEAEAALKEAKIAFQTHAKDAALGILVPENFVVCEVERINDRMVRLEVAKRGC